MYNAVFVVIGIAIGILVVITVNKYRNTPPPLSPEEKIAHQVEAVYQLVKITPNIRGFFIEAERDSATHVKTVGGDGIAFYGDGIAFYRVHDGIYEKRILFIPERPGMGKLGWVNNWRPCRELPPDVVSISSAHVYPY
jgi:hypothetical protein